MSAKVVRVVTRPKTLSGKRGGMILDLPKHDADAWIERRWADPVSSEVEPTEPERKGKAKPRL